MKTIQYILFFLVLKLCLSSNLEDIGDCIIGRRPELSETNFSNGYLSSYYFFEISAGIKNEPNDNDYDYFFDIDESNLPLGIDYTINNRTLSFFGFPTERGIFEIKVCLNVEGYQEIHYDEDGDIYYTDGLCSSYTFETYTLIIE